jgi:hypothetical protein
MFFPARARGNVLDGVPRATAEAAAVVRTMTVRTDSRRPGLAVVSSPRADAGCRRPGPAAPRASAGLRLCCLACRRPGPVPAAVTALIAAAAGVGGGAQ